VTWLHSPEEAKEAERAFDRVFVAKQAPQEMEELRLDGELLADGSPAQAHLPAVMAKAFGVTRSEARRLLAEGGVSLEGERLEGDVLDVPVEALDGRVLRVGKRRFVRLRA
jgi:tyrosyl-tRNA synthetase